MSDFLTMDDFNFKDKTVLLRVDFNSPLDDSKKITDDTRIRMHSPTVKELMDDGAKVVILAHQGRPGDPDFSTLEQHAERLSKILKRPVKYVADVYGEKAQNTIKKLKAGEVLVLENVRTINDETIKKSVEDFAKTDYIKTLSSLADFYINDGFAVSHRANASVVGFQKLLPTLAGRVMERELKALEKAKKAEDRPCMYIMGGAKAEDAAAISEYVLLNKTADFVLTGGVIGQLFLYAKGVNIGDINIKFLEKRDFIQYIPKIKDLFKKFETQIITPVDFGIEVDGKRRDITIADLPTKYAMYDIGPKTVEKYKNLIIKAKLIILSGPMGVYEKDDFVLGTKGIFDAVTNSKAFSVAGGGNTIEILEKLGLSQKISYISTGGGALMEFLTGKNLPGVEALKATSLNK